MCASAARFSADGNQKGKTVNKTDYLGRFTLFDDNGLSVDGLVSMFVLVRLVQAQKAGGNRFLKKTGLIPNIAARKRPLVKRSSEVFRFGGNGISDDPKYSGLTLNQYGVASP